MGSQTENSSDAEFLWVRKKDTSLQFWPKASIERSLIKPTAPAEFVSSDSRDMVTAPPPLPVKILEARGIPHAAISSHAAGFYTQRSHENFNIISYTTGGSAVLKIDGKTIRLKKGMFFYASSKAEYSLKISRSWQSFFFHMEKSKRWNSAADSVYLVGQAKYFDEIRHPTEKFFEEVYRPCRSLLLLDMYAGLIEYFIRLELGGAGGFRARLDALAGAVLEDGGRGLSAKTAAVELGVKVYELDKICKKIHGVKFAKFIENARMQKAKEMLLGARRADIAETARLCGYANAHSFSRAFSRKFNMPPTEFAARANPRP